MRTIGGAAMVILLATATAAEARRTDAHPAWLVGEWARIAAGERIEGDPCNSFGRITYHRDGRYDVMDEAGRWSASPRRVTEVMLSAGGTGDPAALHKRVSYPIGRIEGRRIDIGGANPGHLLRCGPDRAAVTVAPPPRRASRSRRSASGRAR